MKLEINIWLNSTSYSVYTNTDTNELIINGEIVDKGVKTFTKYATDILKTWPESLSDKNILDTVLYRIEVTNSRGTKTFVGNNKAPDNFDNLISLINNYSPSHSEIKIREEKLEFIKHHNLPNI